MALVLVSLAAGALAAAAASGGRTLLIARRDAAAVMLALARLDALRAGPRLDGADVTTASDGTPYARQWRVTPGRGRPDQLDVAVAWPDHSAALSSAVLP